MQIAWFKELSKKSVPLVGGKAANLGEMVKIKLPVPPGFVVTAQAYLEFIEQTRIKNKIYKILSKLRAEDTEKTHDAAEAIQELILEQEIPVEIKNDIIHAYENLQVDTDIFKLANKDTLQFIKAGRDLPYVAVRSSATAEDSPEASFAGQNRTFLNIIGKENVVKAVQQCWASLFTARSIYYRIKNNFSHEKVLIAVIIQKMVNSKKSGVIFTVDPTTNKDEIVIEAGWGLGEAVVSGAINPDNYKVDKNELKIIDKKINKQEWMFIRDINLGRTIKKTIRDGMQESQVLEDNEIIKLANFAKKIEEHYGTPQDIEFAIEDHNIYIVQTRPITTTKKEFKEEKLEQAGEPILTGLGASPGIATGNVKIVHDLEDLSKIEKGDILVTRMTTPDMVPSLERASAVITNEGGSTCFSGDTKILTDKGFMTMGEICEEISQNRKLKTLSLDPKTYQIKWKSILATIKRKAELCKIQVSPTLRSKQNFLKVTLDHKFLTLENRKLLKKELNNILLKKEGILVADRIPSLNISDDEIKKCYLYGALFSDGSLSVNKRGGYVINFSQNIEKRKLEFIDSVSQSFEESYGEKLRPSTSKNRPNELNLRCFKKEIHNQLLCVKQNIVSTILSMEKEQLLAFIGGYIDGDGSLGDHQILITVGEKNINMLEGLVCCLLRLGVSPHISKTKSWYIIHLTERIEKLLKYSKKIKNSYDKKFGDKFFISKQIISDVIDKINYRGKMKHAYLTKDLMISDKAIKKRVILRVNNKEEFLKLINSDFEMNRVKFEENLGENPVYNLTVDSKDELGHNYVVFTSNYTPVIVGNCHAAIVSRELGIPAIVGTETATQVLKENQEVTVDAYNGKVYEGKVALEKHEEVQIGEVGETKTKIYMNLSLPDEIDEHKDLPIDGIGLMRIEFLIASKIREHPLFLIETGEQYKYVNVLSDGISKVASAINPKPIIVRFSDFKTNEYRDLEGGEKFEPHEDNPLIGWRGVSRYISDEFIEAFKLECQAIKKVRDSGLKNVHVMLPFVRTTKEVEKVLEIMKEQGLERREDFKIALMAEVPSIIFLADEFCKYCDLFSIGSNDLTMLILGVDRDSAILGKMGYFDERNEAVKRAIKSLIETAHQHNVKVSLCGQAPSVYSEFVEFLVKNKIDSISVNPDAVLKVKKAVSEIEKNVN